MKLGLRHSVFFVLCVGCNDPNVAYPVITDAGSSWTDAYVDATPEAAHVNPSTLCCTTANTDPVWGNTSQCDQEDGISFICGENDGGTVYPCDDSRCNVGSWCQWVTGYGTVTLCQDE